MLIAGLLPTAASPAEGAGNGGLRAYEAHYSFSWHGLNAGSARFTLQRLTAQEWTYTSRTEPRGLFRLVAAADALLESRMSVDTQGVRPLHFTAHQGHEAAASAELSFDWALLRVTGHVDGQSVDMGLRTGVQDDLSVQIALIHALGLGTAPTGIALFDKSGVRDYAYIRVGEATLSTPLGEVATVIYRTQRAGSPRSTHFWCAPAYGYIPLRAEQWRNGEPEWRMELRSLRRD